MSEKKKIGFFFCKRNAAIRRSYSTELTLCVTNKLPRRRVCVCVRENVSIPKWKINKNSSRPFITRILLCASSGIKKLVQKSHDSRSFTVSRTMSDHQQYPNTQWRRGNCFSTSQRLSDEMERKTKKKKKNNVYFFSLLKKKIPLVYKLFISKII